MRRRFDAAEGAQCAICERRISLSRRLNLYTFWYINIPIRLETESHMVIFSGQFQEGKSWDRSEGASKPAVGFGNPPALALQELTV